MKYKLFYHPIQNNKVILKWQLWQCDHLYLVIIFIRDDFAVSPQGAVLGRVNILANSQNYRSQKSCLAHFKGKNAPKLKSYSFNLYVNISMIQNR